jgi:hypothetical protein
MVWRSPDRSASSWQSFATAGEAVRFGPTDGPSVSVFESLARR